MPPPPTPASAALNAGDTTANPSTPTTPTSHAPFSSPSITHPSTPSNLSRTDLATLTSSPALLHTITPSPAPPHSVASFAQHPQRPSVDLEQEREQQEAWSGQVTRVHSRQQPTNNSHEDGAVKDAEKQQPQQQKPHKDEKQQGQQGGDEVKLEAHEDPQQWSKPRKWATTGLVCLMYFNATLTSSIATGATLQYLTQFDITPFSSALILTVYMAGFALGPPIWAPLSERYGRVPVNLISLPCYLAFNLGCAFSPTYRSLLACRFFVGLFGASPQSNSGATISDIWAPAQRLWPMFLYTTAAFGGPVLGPLCGGFLAGTKEGSERWRWIYIALAILSVVSIAGVLAIQRESYAPVLVRRKRMRIIRSSPTTATATAAAAEGLTKAQRGPTLRDIVTTHVLRPFRMLATELPLVYAAAWTSFAYAVLFLFFEAFPIVYEDIYGFNAGQQGLAFLPLGAGILSTVPVVAYFNRHNLRLRRQNGGKSPPPEARLRQGVLSAPFFAVGL
ncbi:hypothetical protein ACQY0O_005435 [Thecaphora frezii]